ncbi:recombinase family protein, partial [Dokdonia ponticola]
MKNNDFTAFAKFAKASKIPQINSHGKAVIYTRVSTKDQLDNASLETQKKYCELFAKKKGIEVLEYFGGTHESAQSDERKEFQKMLTYVRRHKKEVRCIIVYSYDRFSRTGANGAYISDQLKKKEGIITLSVLQEVDVTTASGSFQQNLYYMFSQFDNELRRDKSVSGMKEKLRKGFWIATVPFGYTNLNPGKGKVQNIVINEQGKLLRYAFKWKANENLSHREIAEKLERKGLIINQKKLSD